MHNMNLTPYEFIMRFNESREDADWKLFERRFPSKITGMDLSSPLTYLRLHSGSAELLGPTTRP
jgi:hypothetical protein